MSPAAVISGYQQIGSIADHFLFPTDKKASTYIKVISVTTDKKSLKASKEIITFLNKKVIPNLPLKKSQLDVVFLTKQLDNIKENQLKINKMFDTISNLFDEGDEVNIDDDKMSQFLINMEKAKNILSYINDYITLAIKVHNADLSIQKSQKKYSADELIAFLKKAN